MAIEANKACPAVAAYLNDSWFAKRDFFDCSGLYYGQHDSSAGDGKCQQRDVNS